MAIKTDSIGDLMTWAEKLNDVRQYMQSYYKAWGKLKGDPKNHPPAFVVTSEMRHDKLCGGLRKFSLKKPRVVQHRPRVETDCYIQIAPDELVDECPVCKLRGGLTDNRKTS